MKHLIDKEKFLLEISMELQTIKEGKYIYVGTLQNLLSKHLKDLVEEPQHPSGMDHDRISIRNELIVELRES